MWGTFVAITVSSILSQGSQIRKRYLSNDLPPSDGVCISLVYLAFSFITSEWWNQIPLGLEEISSIT